MLHAEIKCRTLSGPRRYEFVNALTMTLALGSPKERSILYQISIISISGSDSLGLCRFAVAQNLFNLLASTCYQRFQPDVFTVSVEQQSRHSCFRWESRSAGPGHGRNFPNITRYHWTTWTTDNLVISGHIWSYLVISGHSPCEELKILRNEGIQSWKLQAGVTLQTSPTFPIPDFETPKRKKKNRKRMEEKWV